MSGTEGISRLFSFELDLLAEDGAIDFDKLLGAEVSVRADLSGGTPRFFNGIVSRFHQAHGSAGRLASYAATLVPRLWLLTRSADCRVYQEKTIPEILKDVLQRHGIEHESRLTGTYSPWEVCVQYRETDFNFLSRLMEQEGIFYFFEQDQDAHKLVLGDSVSAHAPCPGCQVLPYRAFSGGAVREQVTSWSIERTLQPGAYALSDYQFKTPRDTLRGQYTQQRAHQQAARELFDYPGEYEAPGEARAYSRIRLDELQAQHEIIAAETTAPGLCAGGTFTLRGHARPDQNREYLITAVVHRFSGDSFDSGATDSASPYAATLTAIASDQPFRPPRLIPRPSIPGTQTATVVGPAGKEVQTDKYARVRVRFHWDRHHDDDPDASAWIRVAQPVAGRRWGASFWPRIGQEVVVSFLEGDPDQPIITGCVYNGEQMPPYIGDGPDEDHRNDPLLSGIKTNSSPGGEGFNELRFDDNQGSEQLFAHAEKDLDVRVKNDARQRIYGNAHTIVGWRKDGDAGGDLRQMIHQDHHLSIKRHQVQHIEGHLQLTIGKGEAPDAGQMDLWVDADQRVHVGAQQHLAVVQDRVEKIGGSADLQVGLSQQTRVGQKIAWQAGQEVHLKSGMTLIIEAGAQISLKVGGNFINIGPDGVSIQGTMVKINSGGAPASGSGAAPQSPQSPQQAAPRQPDAAKDTVSGRKSAYE